MEALLEGKEVKSVKEQALPDNGFVFRYHTHNRINQGDQKAYIFCFEYGNIAKKTVVHHRKGDYLRIMIFTPLRFWSYLLYFWDKPQMQQALKFMR